MRVRAYRTVDRMRTFKIAEGFSKPSAILAPGERGALAQASAWEEARLREEAWVAARLAAADAARER